MKKVGKKLVAASLCACLTATALTGCGSNADKTVIQVDDTIADYGLVQLDLRYSQMQIQDIYETYFGSELWSTFGDSAKSSVVDTLETMMVLEDHMEEYGVTISEEEKSAISEAAKAFIESNDEETLKAMSADEETVERLLTLYTIEAKMYYAIIANADTNVSDEEAAQKTVQYVSFSTATTDSDGNTTELSDEEKAEQRALAEQLLAAVEGGQSMEEALAEIDESKSVVTDSYGTDNGDLTDDVKAVAESLTEDGQLAPEVVETDGAYYVVQMVSTFDEEATADYKEEIIAERQQELYDGIVDGWFTSAEITVNDALIAGMDFVDRFEYAEEAENALEAE